MRNSLYLASSMALALSLAACGNDNGAASPDQIDNAVGVNEAVADLRDDNMTADAATPTTGAEFANMAAASDMFEIESAKIAAGKAVNADVKAFAAMLSKDHTKSSADLKAAGAKASPAIVPNPVLTAEQTANLAALRNATGEAFDTLYLGQQVTAHEKALALLKGYSAGGDTESLKDFATKTVLPVQMHLDRAKELSR